MRVELQRREPHFNYVAKLGELAQGPGKRDPVTNRLEQISDILLIRFWWIVGYP